MLPLVLGGIALAAVGYGVKEYCESEGCPWDDTSSTNVKKNAFETLHTKKADLYNRNFSTLKKQLSMIKNFKTMPLDIWDEKPTEEKLECSNLTREIKVYVDVYTDILSSSDDILKGFIHKLTEIMATSVDYKKYSKEDKKSLKKIYKFIQKMQGIYSLKLLDDDKCMSVDSIVALRRYVDIVSHYHENPVERLLVPMFLNAK